MLCIEIKEHPGGKGNECKAAMLSTMMPGLPAWDERTAHDITWVVMERKEG